MVSGEDLTRKGDVGRREGRGGIYTCLEAMFQEGGKRVPGWERRGGLCGVRGGRERQQLWGEVSVTHGVIR